MTAAGYLWHWWAGSHSELQSDGNLFAVPPADRDKNVQQELEAYRPSTTEKISLIVI